MEETCQYRGLVRMSLTAGIVVSALATGVLAVGVMTGVVPSSIFGVRELFAVAIRGFGAGVVAGGLFAWFVARGERRQTLSTLSARRVALWGGLAIGGVFLLAGLAVPGILPISIVATAAIVAAVGGSVASAGMLQLARRTPESPKELNRGADRLLP